MVQSDRPAVDSEPSSVLQSPVNDVSSRPAADYLTTQVASVHRRDFSLMIPTRPSTAHAQSLPTCQPTEQQRSAVISPAAYSQSSQLAVHIEHWHATSVHVHAHISCLLQGDHFFCKTWKCQGILQL